MTSYTTRTAIAVLALFLLVSYRALPGKCEEPWQPVVASPMATAKAQEPAILKAIVAARWRLSRARAVLPPVQLVHSEHLEIQDFVQHAFDGGALRLCVSPGHKGGSIFAVLVDTREPRYENFARLTSTERYATYHHGAYVVVVPLQLVSPDVFDRLRLKLWTEQELQQLLGAASYHWHVHGVGYLGLSYIPQGLSFMGDWQDARSAVKYQLFARDSEEQWQTEHDSYDRPPLALLSRLDAATLQGTGRAAFANELLSQREQIDQGLANGKRSPDGRFVVGHVNVGGLANTEEVVIRERGKPERRYPAPYFTDDKDYLWLDARTIVFKAYAVDEKFYTIDARTGATKLVATLPDEHPFEDRLDSQRVVDFGVSGAHRFWYKTTDGQVHDVTIQPAP